MYQSRMITMPRAELRYSRIAYQGRAPNSGIETVVLRKCKWSETQFPGWVNASQKMCVAVPTRMENTVIAKRENGLTGRARGLRSSLSRAPWGRQAGRGFLA